MNRRTQYHLDQLREYHFLTYEHSERVSEIAVRLSQSLATKQDNKWLGFSGKVHDLGKINVPHEILEKSGDLTALEKSIMQSHVRWSIILLGDSPNYVKSNVGSHHEFSPNPYPRARRDRRIWTRDTVDVRTHSAEERERQILAISDLYDALRSPRSYKPALTGVDLEIAMLNGFTGNVRYIEQVLKLESV